MIKMEARRTAAIFFTLSLIALGVVVMVCVALGSVAFSPRDVLGSLANAVTGREIISDVAETAAPILWAIRAPRVLLAALVGASLSVAGAAMQGLLQNPLADGSTLGVTAGGSLGAVIAIAFGLSMPWLGGLAVTGVSILFSFCSLLLILWFSHRIDRNLSSNTIIMSGIIFSMLASSMVNLILSFVDDSHMRSIVFWTMGSFAGRGWPYVGAMAVFAAGGILALLLKGRELDAFAMGEEQAMYAGVNTRGTRLWVLIAASALCGASVSMAGSVAFIGLTIPHMLRLLIGPVHRYLLPACALWGAIFLMLCDLLARTVVAPLELPVGIVTSLIGAGTFLAIFYSRRAK